MGKALRSTIPILDAYSKATGTARFAGDIGFHADDPPRAVLRAKVVRSPHALADVEEIDDSAARTLPGYRGMVTFRDVPGYRDGTSANERSPVRSDRLFMNRRARYVGDAVAAVAADDEYTAQRALDLIRVVYDVHDAHPDAEQNLARDIRAIHDEGVVAGFGGPQPARMPTVEYKRGNIEQGFAQADLIVEGRYVTPIQCHVPIEPHAVVALWQGESVTFWDSQQSVFAAQETIALALGLDRKNVRVISHLRRRRLWRQVHGHARQDAVSGDRCPALPTNRQAGQARVFTEGTAVRRRHAQPVRLSSANRREERRLDDGVRVQGDRTHGRLRVERARCRQRRRARHGRDLPNPELLVSRLLRLHELAGRRRVPRLRSSTGGVRTRNAHRRSGRCDRHGSARVPATEQPSCWRSDRHRCRAQRAADGDRRRGVPAERRGGDRVEHVAAPVQEDRLDCVAASGCDSARSTADATRRTASSGWTSAGKIHVPIGSGNLGTNAHTGIALIVANALDVPVEELDCTWGDSATCTWDFVSDASRAVHCHGKAMYNAALDLRRQIDARRAGRSASPNGLHAVLRSRHRSESLSRRVNRPGREESRRRSCTSRPRRSRARSSPTAAWLDSASTCGIHLPRAGARASPKSKWTWRPDRSRC